MSIKTIIDNYEHICGRIKRTNEDMKDLKQRKKELEKQLEEYLVRSKERGIISGNTEISLEKKEKKEKVGRKKREEAILKILNDRCISNPESIISEISKVSGEIRETNVLKVKRSN